MVVVVHVLIKISRLKKREYNENNLDIGLADRIAEELKTINFYFMPIDLYIFTVIIFFCF